MTKLRYFLYELGSTAIGLAILAFFGTIIFLPIEIVIMGEGQTVFLVFILITLSIVIAFFILSFIHKKYLLLIIRIVDILAVISLIFVINAFLAFTQDLFEPWLIQAAWFWRYNGMIVGMFLGIITIKTITGLSYIISKFNEPGEGNEIKEDKNPKIIALLIIVSSFLFYCVEMLFFRYSSLFAVLLFSFICTLALVAYSILLIINNSYFDFVRLQISKQYVAIPQNIQLNEKTTVDNEQIPKQSSEKGNFSAINSKISSVGNNPSSFWYLGVPLICVLILGIISIVLYPFNLIIHIAFPYQVGAIQYDLPINQLFALYFDF